ncbi:hypothetical protein G9A89_020687 [Geosiphon pyriformis]|nr:hypothetical protein G9A89_020687 [Geosiphon pyriformis]
MNRSSERDDFPFSLTTERGVTPFSPSGTTSNSEGPLSLKSFDSVDQTNLEVLSRRLKIQFEDISALVKDVNEKLSKEFVETKCVENGLEELLRSIEKFKALQQVCLIYDFVDDMDEIGVSLWNASSAMKTTIPCSGKEANNELIALIRQVGLTMIDVGSVVNTDDKTIIKMLTLATKVGKAWLDCGRSDKADQVLRSASFYEDGVLSIQSRSNIQQAKCAALIVYYAYRAEAAWKLANSHVANLMIQHATDPNHLDYVTPREVEILCQVCFSIGHQASREGKTGDAIKWLRKCHDLLSDRMPEKEAGRTKILTNTLNILALSYLKNSNHNESNMDLAENSINLCLEEDPGNILASSLKLKIMKIRNANNANFEEVYIGLMKAAQLNKENLKIILNIAHFVSETSPFLALSGLDILLEETLSEIRNVGYIEKAIITKFHIIGNSNQKLDLDDAIKSAEISLGYEQRHGIVIGHKAKVACQLILWQNGDRHYINQKYEVAKRWYNLAYKWLASNQTDGKNAATLQRKIALCYLEENALANAIESIRQAQTHEKNSAANYYILFHISIERGQMDQAAQYLHHMCKGENFHTNMLAMAANEAYQKNNKEILIEALKEILIKHRSEPDVTHVDILVLLSPCSNSQKELSQQALKDIYNYRKFRIKLGKRKRNDDDTNHDVSEDLSSPQTTSEIDTLLVLLFEFEAKVNLGLWDELQAVLDSASACDFDVPPKIYERMAELLIEVNECPSTAIFSTLQALLDSLIKDKDLDVEQFSRWFRMMVITALVKGKQTAIQHFTQALDILKDCSKGKYPEEEIQWLMVTAWNCGIDYYSANDYPQAKKWCEIAMAYCKYIKNGMLYEHEMRKSYGEIMKNCDFNIARNDPCNL